MRPRTYPATGVNEPTTTESSAAAVYAAFVERIARMECERILAIARVVLRPPEMDLLRAAVEGAER